MIRPATLDDMPALLEMGEAFHKESNWADFVDYDEASWRQTLYTWLLSPNWRILVFYSSGVQGFICGAITPLYFNNSVSVSHELLLWVRPNHRKGAGGDLMDAFHQGVDIHVQTVSETTPRWRAFLRLLLLRKWRPLERSLLKVNK